MKKRIIFFHFQKTLSKESHYLGISFHLHNFHHYISNMDIMTIWSNFLSCLYLCGPVSRIHIWETQLVIPLSVSSSYYAFNIITVRHKQRILLLSLQKCSTFYEQYFYITFILTVHLLMCTRDTMLSKHSLIVIRTQHSIVHVLSSIWYHQLSIYNFLSLKCTRIIKKIQSLFGMDQKSSLNYFRSLAKSFCIMSKRYL